MKFSWQLNLGLQALLFSGFVLIYMSGPGQVYTGASERTAPVRQNVPMPGASVDAVVSLGSSGNPHRIGIAHMDKEREISGYSLGRGEPPDGVVQAVRRALLAHDRELLAKTGIEWIILTRDYKLKGRELTSTGGSAPNGLIIVNLSLEGDHNTIASHVHHELYWIFEQKFAPALKSGWPGAEYNGDYHVSRQLFRDAPRCHVSAFGASHPVADRAEIFRAMVGFSDGLRLAASGDDCLANKVELLKKNIEQHLPQILHLVSR